MVSSSCPAEILLGSSSLVNTRGEGNVIKIGLALLQPFENRGIKNMHNTSRNEKMAWQTGGTGPSRKNI